MLLWTSSRRRMTRLSDGLGVVGICSLAKLLQPPPQGRTELLKLFSLGVAHAQAALITPCQTRGADTMLAFLAQRLADSGGPVSQVPCEAARHVSQVSCDG
jgi:hypothetical protein